MDEVEANLSLVGATAIEDMLQEGVPDTIASLRKMLASKYGSSRGTRSILPLILVSHARS